MFPWLQHHPRPEGAFPHVPDRGAAPAAGGAAGGRIHALHHHQTLRLLSVRHQRHHVTRHAGKRRHVRSVASAFLDSSGIGSSTLLRLGLPDTNFVILLESGSDFFFFFVRILESTESGTLPDQQTLEKRPEVQKKNKKPLRCCLR